MNTHTHVYKGLWQRLTIGEPGYKIYGSTFTIIEKF